MADNIFGGYHLATHQVVGHIQQCANKDLITGNALFLDDVTAGVFRHALTDETTFGTYRHDNRVLHLLGFHQPQHFGAVIFKAVRPAQAAAGYFTAPQMHAFYPRRANKNLEHWSRLRHTRDFRRFKLISDVVLKASTFSELIVVGAQRGENQLHKAAQQLVIVKAGNAFQAFIQARYALVGGVTLLLRVKAQAE